MGVVDQVVALADALSESDRLAIARGLLGTIGVTDDLERFENGYVLYTDHGTQECTSWLIAPGTNLNPAGWLGFVYFVGLLYVFLGIAIISDIFMAAIEVITAAEGTRKFKQANGTVVEYAYKLVNPTVANLTLMALGSSAPEILLAIIGTIQTLDTMPDELGPSTIVGSAAFNLLMITAICMSALPGGQTKKINDLAVYAVTATFSLVAYIWLYIVLAVVSPDVVEIWEAFVTLGLFGAMLSIAYVVDVRGKCCRPPRDETDVDQARRDSDPQLSKDGLMEELHHTRQLNNQRSMASCSTLAQSAEPSTGYPQNHTGFMRGLTGQRRLVEHVSTTEGFQPSEQLDGSQRGGSQRGGSQRSTHPEAGARASVTTGNASLGVVTPAQTKPFSASSAAMLAKADESVLHIAQFGAAQYVVREDWQHATCVITLEPACSDRRVVVSWRAVSHDSECDDELFDAAAQPFVGASGMAVFEPGVRSVAVAVELAPSAIPADDCALFSLVATRAWVEPSKGVAPQPSARETSMRAQANAILGARTRTEVKAYGKRSPLQPAHGQLRFSAAKVVCEECCGTVEVIVTRVNGLDGTISCLFATRDGSAKAGSDYVHQEGALVFLPGEREKAIVLDIIDDDVEEDTEAFTVELLPTDVVTIRGPSEASGAGVVLASESVCVIEIIDDDSWKDRMRRMRAALRSALAQKFHAQDKWSDRFKEAVELSGGVDEETGEELPAGVGDTIMHAVSLFWKLQFAFVPPSSWYNGWPAFFVSLVFIGIWTAVVGELASLFGCVVGLGDAITAITFVALGTSLPDTFASRLAMLHDEYADASVGNVTGSNSVNVFLGLGIPWVIGSLYHRLAPNGKGQYDVPAGALGFSVALFCAIACVAILTLVGRRILTGGEIGGSYLSSRLASLWFSTLWLIYIVLASLNIKGIIDIEV